VTLERVVERFADPERTRSTLGSDGDAHAPAIEHAQSAEMIDDPALFWHSGSGALLDHEWQARRAEQRQVRG